MPIVDIRIIQNTFTHDEKRDAIERLSETLLDVWARAFGTRRTS